MITAEKPSPAQGTSQGPPQLPAPHKYDSAFGPLRHLLFGRALQSSQAGHIKLPKFLALPIFSSDTLSSNAYATEAILSVLLVTSVSVGALRFVIPIAIGICILMAIVVLSY